MVRYEYPCWVALSRHRPCSCFLQKGLSAGGDVASGQILQYRGRHINISTVRSIRDVPWCTVNLHGIEPSLHQLYISHGHQAISAAKGNKGGALISFSVFTKSIPARVPVASIQNTNARGPLRFPAYANPKFQGNFQYRHKKLKEDVVSGILR
ncbi:hypothetical protein HYFRA_00004237 [Hymenoscyphus fraxineus]|uniref:Uncharacterized protein n=1 Tax=Hymenoscyphus fraxineus TaxID=746836 RepID=A0A9N9KPW9_9HELO|nr:hypothetical protein HYFRA_00004237 [Hymenoscyphus fraxineus]